MNTITKISAANLARRTFKDNFYKGLVIFLSLITISPIVLIIYQLIAKGIKQISFDFIIKTPPDTFEAMTALSNGELIP